LLFTVAFSVSPGPANRQHLIPKHDQAVSQCIAVIEAANRKGPRLPMQRDNQT